jgi:hypothetical protein
MKLEKTYADIAAYGEKYHFYHNADNGTIVCTTMYKGQMVRGIAKCSPEDNFDIETGKKLAYLRCKEKFSRKKLRRARSAYEESVIVEARAKNNLNKAVDFVNDSNYQLELATNELINFENELGINN